VPQTFPFESRVFQASQSISTPTFPSQRIVTKKRKKKKEVFFLSFSFLLASLAIFPYFSALKMLEVKNLQATLNNKHILRGIDLSVHPNEIHALLGPNGSGKSTFGRVLLGDTKYKTTGAIHFCGKNREKQEPSERAQAGFFLAFQSPPELDGVSAREFLFASQKSIDPNFHSSFRFKKALTKRLSQFRLAEEFSEREMNKGASGGERRKMEMVSLLTLNPKLAFLDEIDSGIDVDAMKTIAEGIQEFMTQKEKSVILVSHTEKLLQLVQPTHCHILVEGLIVASGGPELVQEIHKNGFTRFLKNKS